MLETGGIIVYPCEGVLGLGCDPFRRDAVRRLLALKRRPESMGFILIASAFGQIRSLIAPLPASAVAALEDSWPGPVTWIVPAAARVPDWLTGGRSTLALRVTAHPEARAICSVFRGARCLDQRQPQGQSPSPESAGSVPADTARGRLRRARPHRRRVGPHRDT